MAERSRADAYQHIDRGQHDRLRRTRVHNDALVSVGTLRYGVWRAPEIEALKDGAARHTVTVADIGHMDLIAKQHYDDETLWWVIAWVNRVRNPITDMAIGQQLLIPELRLVAQTLADII